MQFGFYVNGQYPDDRPLADAAENLAAQVRAARDAGFSSIIVPHHYLTAPLRMF